MCIWANLTMTVFIEEEHWEWIISFAVMEDDNYTW